MVSGCSPRLRIVMLPQARVAPTSAEDPVSVDEPSSPRYSGPALSSGRNPSAISSATVAAAATNRTLKRRRLVRIDDPGIDRQSVVAAQVYPVPYGGPPHIDAGRVATGRREVHRAPVGG